MDTNDIKNMFGSEDLSEEFVTKATTLFETAVDAKVAERVLEISEKFENDRQNDLLEATKFMEDAIDACLHESAEKWIEDNKLVIEETAANARNADFVEAMEKLFTEHFRRAPEGQEDVMEALEAEVAQLRADLAEQLSNNEALVNKLQQVEIAEAFRAVSEGLAETQIEKLAKLAEAISYDNVEQYVAKLATIKESFFSAKNDNASSQQQLGEEKTAAHDDMMAAYISAISKSIAA